MILPPSWLQDTRLKRLWWLTGTASLLTALSESALGLWVRNFSTQADSHWLWMLVALLALRLAFSAWRDFSGEELALRSRTAYQHATWSAFQPATQEQQQVVEAGTRAALQLRTGVVSLGLLLPTMAILAPSLALGAFLCAVFLGLASRGRTQALRPRVQADLITQERFEAQELWARRALPEAVAGGFAARLARLRTRDGLHFLKARLSLAIRWQQAQTMMEIGAHAASVLLCALAFLQWRSNALPIGQFLSFLALALLAYRPVREAGRALPACSRAAQLSVPEPMPAPAPTGPMLELAEVEFGFAATLFHGLSFSLQPGEVALLHGPNGSGKSTLLRLCAGQLAPGAGRLTLPAGQIHWVDQETVLPPLSLRRLTLLSQAPTSDACQHFFTTHVAPFLPGLDWDTPPALGGSLLSRGQRIRLRLWALACAPGALWLLDEPLSALPRPERLDFLKALLACRQGASVLMADQEIPDVPCQTLISPARGPSIHRLLGW